MLLLNARFLILSHPPHLNAVTGHRRHSNALDDLRMHTLNACEGVSENAALLSDCWP